MRTVAIVQARMTSTRLPGKILTDLAGAPMLERQVARMRRATTLDEVMVATTTNASDDPVVALCERLGIASHRGSEHDVLSRYAGAAAASRADVVVRITADCPLLDATVVDRVVQALRADDADYASNTLVRTYPRGLDVEALTRAALDRAAGAATSTPAREHVTWYIHTERPEIFKRSSVVSEIDASDLRWTVDTPEDLAMVRAVYEGLSLAQRDLRFEEILTWVRAHPAIATMNAAVEQKQH
jgi:spore coat polysaccharide biosynthesis protein SpsF